MPHKDEQLCVQDVLFFTYLKTIDIGNALVVWKKRKSTIPITIFIELIYVNFYINYQSEITIIFPEKNGKLIAFDEGECKLILPLWVGSSRAGCHPLLSDFRLADYHNSLDFMRNRANTCSTPCV